MTQVNKDFIKAKQVRLDEKSKEYDGEDNPKNYKNMDEIELWNLINDDVQNVYLFLYVKSRNKKLAIEKLVDISNRCGMLWERLEESEER